MGYDSEYVIFRDDDEQFWIANNRGQTIIRGPYDLRETAEAERETLKENLRNVIEKGW